MATGIGSTNTRNTCIDNICTIHIWIEYAGFDGACIKVIYAESAFIRDVKPRTLMRSAVLLVGQEINDCYYQLLIRFIFTLIGYISC